MILLTILLAGMIRSLHWQAAWFEVLPASDDNVVFNILSFCLDGVIMLDVKSMAAFLGTAFILKPSVSHSSSLLMLTSFSASSEWGGWTKEGRGFLDGPPVTVHSGPTAHNSPYNSMLREINGSFNTPHRASLSQTQGSRRWWSSLWSPL